MMVLQWRDSGDLMVFDWSNMGTLDDQADQAGCIKLVGFAVFVGL